MKIFIPANLRIPLIVIAGIFVTGLAGYGITRIGKKAPDIVTHTVTRGEFIIDIKTTGEFDAVNSTSVTVPNVMYGQLKIVSLIEDGTQVKEGEVLVQFDSSEMQNMLKTRRDNFERERLNLATQEATLNSQIQQQKNAILSQELSFEQARLSYDRMQFEPEIRRREAEIAFRQAEINLDEARTKVSTQELVNKSTLAQAQLRFKQAETQYNQMEEQVNSLILRAPKDGMAVLQKMFSQSGSQKIKVGDSVWRGLELVQIPDLTKMRVKTKVNENMISRVAQGQRVVVTIDAVPDLTLYGSITTIARLARQDQESDFKVFDIDVLLDSTDERIKPGMSSHCTIITDKIDDVVFVPLEAVFHKNDTTNVYVRRAGFDLRPVKLGMRNDDFIVIESGLDPGQQVALRDPTIDLINIGGQSRTSSSNSPSGRGNDNQGGN